jgi:hypothetical protein
LQDVVELGGGEVDGDGLVSGDATGVLEEADAVFVKGDAGDGQGFGAGCGLCLRLGRVGGLGCGGGRSARRARGARRVGMISFSGAVLWLRPQEAVECSRMWRNICRGCGKEA